MNALLLEPLLAALGVGPQRVTAVDDDVARFEQWDELFDDGIHRRASFHHDLRAAGTFERGDKIRERFSKDEVFPLAPPSLERLDDAGGAVENGDAEAAALHVQDEVFAHYGEADQADVTGAHSYLDANFRRRGG